MEKITFTGQARSLNALNGHGSAPLGHARLGLVSMRSVWQDGLRLRLQFCGEVNAMTQAQVWNEVQGWTPNEKWALVEALLRDLQAGSGNAPLHQAPTPLGDVPTVRAASLKDMAGTLDLGGNALTDTEALYD
jgi:hypothetical protein